MPEGQRLLQTVSICMIVSATKRSVKPDDVAWLCELMSPVPG